MRDVFVDFEEAFNPSEEKLRQTAKFIIDYQKKATKRKDCVRCKNTYWEYWNNHGHDDHTTHCKFSRECVDFSNGKKCPNWDPKEIDTFESLMGKGD